MRADIWGREIFRQIAKVDIPGKIAAHPHQPLEVSIPPRVVGMPVDIQGNAALREETKNYLHIYMREAIVWDNSDPTIMATTMTILIINLNHRERVPDQEEVAGVLDY